MANTTMEELRKTVELLKEIETLQDESIRVRMQWHVLDLLGPTPAPTALNGEPSVGLAEAQQKARTTLATPKELRPAKMPEAGTIRARVYEAVAILGSPEKPVCAAELEQDLPDLVEGGRIAKTLSQLFLDRLLSRTQADDLARDGYERGLYKYYVPAGRA